MFELRGVTKSFDGARAVDGIDLDVSPARSTALIGPSGCGKSTLLRLMLGLAVPTAGTVRFEGEPVTEASSPALRRRMGYVVQGGGLFPHLTALENAALLARHLGWPDARIRARADELGVLARIDAELWDRYPLQLSGGQQQRVALARALMLDPDVLLLDEPLGALDPIVRAELQDDLKEVFGRLEKTVVFVTHDLGEAAFLGDELVLMDAGEIVQRGTFADLDERPATPFVTRFIGAQRRHAVR